MKRWMCLLLSAALLLLALGCAQKTEEEAEGYDLYFLQAEPDVLDLNQVVLLSVQSARTLRVNE